MDQTETDEDNNQNGKRFTSNDIFTREVKRQRPLLGKAHWKEPEHRHFVEAVFSTGMQNASPSVILDLMTEKPQALTSERVKSHLQKFRKNKSKSTAEFMAEYEAWMQKALTVGAAGGLPSTLSPPDSILTTMGTKPLVGGDMGAFLSYCAMYEEALESDPGCHDTSSATAASATNEYKKCISGAKVPFPVLTEEERQTPLGVSISHVVNLFYSMTKHLQTDRKVRAQQQQGNDRETGSMSFPEAK